MPRSSSPFPPDQAAPPCVAGTRIGKYELISRLAMGGMAEIFLARATGIEGFEKQVVLKRILPQYAADEAFIRMFLDEARLAATLHHANVVQVYDIGLSGGAYFFTMEYVEGVDLRQIIAESRRQGGGPLPLEHAVTILLGAAAGLHHAHQKLGADGKSLGIVHRDVSPSNVLVSFDGCVKVADFGIAKAASSSSQTRTGTLKGKLSYMSPEQCLGEPLDRRSDVFALGILLYEMTTGARLFQSESEPAILNQILHRPVPRPGASVPGYPPELERIIMTALARQREQRYASAEELQLDLEAFAREHRLACSPVALSRYVGKLFGPARGSSRRVTPGAAPVAVDVGATVATEPAGPLHREEIVAARTEVAPLAAGAAAGTKEALRRPKVAEGSATERLSQPSSADPRWPARRMLRTALGFAGLAGVAALVVVATHGGSKPHGAVSPDAAAVAPARTEPVTAAAILPDAGPPSSSGAARPVSAIPNIDIEIGPSRPRVTPAKKDRAKPGRQTGAKWDPDSPILPP